MVPAMVLAVVPAAWIWYRLRYRLPFHTVTAAVPASIRYRLRYRLPSIRYRLWYRLWYQLPSIRYRLRYRLCLPYGTGYGTGCLPYGTDYGTGGTGCGTAYGQWEGGERESILSPQKAIQKFAIVSTEIPPRDN